MKKEQKNKKVNTKPVNNRKKRSVMKNDERAMTWILVVCLGIVVVAVGALAIYSAIVDREPEYPDPESSSSEPSKEQSEDFRIGNIGYTVTGNGEVEVYFYYNSSNVEGDDITVPETVEHKGVSYTVTAFSDYAFLDASPALVVIPKTVRAIGIECFGDTQNISIIFRGSLEAWEKIDMDADMNSGWLDSATVSFDEQ